MILLDKIAITRSGRILFEDFTFSLNDGDNVIVSGHNGSGKTTLLEILYGSLHPKAGTVKYDFIDENSGWDERCRKRNSAIHFIPAQALHDVLGNKPDLHYQQRYYNTEDCRWLRYCNKISRRSYSFLIASKWFGWWRFGWYLS